jgi:hypothetical protein
VYLSTAQRHPAAAVKRQQEHDLMTLMGALGALSEVQLQMFFVLHTSISRFARSTSITDGDVAEAVAALAGTFETASRGVLYEQAASSPSAEALRRELKTLLERMGDQRGARFDREVVPVLRGIERGARHEAAGIGSGPIDYLSLVARILHERPPDAGSGASRIIIP